jgi:hypothetical protein
VRGGLEDDCIFSRHSPFLQGLGAVVRGAQMHVDCQLTVDVAEKLVLWKTGVSFLSFRVVSGHMELIGGRWEISSKMPRNWCRLNQFISTVTMLRAGKNLVKISRWNTTFSESFLSVA